MAAMGGTDGSADPGGGFRRSSTVRESLGPDLRGVLTSQPVVHLGEILHTEVAPSLGRAAGEGQVAVASQEHNPVAPVDAGRFMRREDDRDPRAG